MLKSNTTLTDLFFKGIKLEPEVLIGFGDTLKINSTLSRLDFRATFDATAGFKMDSK